jgi:hypothetical protein
MTLHALSPAALLAWIAGASLILLLLHRLKPRARPVRVPTLLFWRTAARRIEARRRSRPLRHLGVWAGLSAASALVLLALAAPDRPPEQRPGVLLLIDLDPGAAAPGEGGSALEIARAEARRALDALPLSVDAALLVAGVEAPRAIGFEAGRPALREALDRLAPPAGPALRPWALARALASARAPTRVLVWSADEPPPQLQGEPGWTWRRLPRNEDPGAILDVVEEGPGLRARVRVLAGPARSLRLREGPRVLFESPPMPPGADEEVRIELPGGAGAGWELVLAPGDPVPATDRWPLADAPRRAAIAWEGLAGSPIGLLLAADPRLELRPGGEPATPRLRPLPMAPQDAAAERVLARDEEGPLLLLGEDGSGILVDSELDRPGSPRLARAGTITGLLSGLRGALGLPVSGPSLEAGSEILLGARPGGELPDLAARGLVPVRIAQSGESLVPGTGPAPVRLLGLPAQVASTMGEAERSIPEAPPVGSRPFEVLLVAALLLFGADAVLHARGRIP